MRYFALVEHRQRHSSDGGYEWETDNTRLGGYLSKQRAIKAILNKAKNGQILNENREVVVLVQEGKVTWQRW